MAQQAGRVAVALALLALVGLASTAELHGGEALSTSELGFVVVLVAIAAVLVIGVGAVAFGSGYATFGDNRRKLISGLLIAALLAGLIALVLAPIDATLTDDPIPRRQPPGEPESGILDGSGGSAAAVVAAIVAAGALLAALLAVVGARVVAERRRRALAEPEAGEEEAVMQAVEGSLDDLRRERDVRRAIIACYARMERALERAGSARRPAEAPFEYLVRILERVTANSRAARALTELFERAKFSTERMGEREKQEAIAALEQLRAEVSAPL